MLANRKGWFIMKCLNKVLTIIGCITAAVAVVTAALEEYRQLDDRALKKILVAGKPEKRK